MVHRSSSITATFPGDDVFPPIACRMARAGLGLEPVDLAANAGVELADLLAFEDGVTIAEMLAPGTIERLYAALVFAGVEFTAMPGKIAGVSVSVRTDLRPRPPLAITGDLRRGSPSPMLMTRWMGTGAVVWHGLTLARLEAAGDFIAMKVLTSAEGVAGPFYFERKDNLLSALQEALVRQGRNLATALLDGLEVAQHFLADKNRDVGANITVTCGDGGEMRVSLTPPDHLESALSATIYPRTPLTLEDAADWLSGAGRIARLLTSSGAGLVDLIASEDEFDELGD